MKNCKDTQVDILGVKIDKISFKDLMMKISGFLHSGTGHYIITANPEIVIKAQKDPEFRDVINKADLVIPDGIGLFFASKIVSRRNNLDDRVQGIDLMYRIVSSFDKLAQKRKVFFLGARGENAKLTALKLKKNFPDFEIAGFFSGEAGEKGDRIAVSIINQTRADVLFVAYGAPKQEKWIARNLKKMPSVRLAIGVGGAFDIISGKISRAPRWMRRIGLEWFWRLLKEPQRIGRIYDATIKFGWLVLTKKREGF